MNIGANIAFSDLGGFPGPQSWDTKKQETDLSVGRCTSETIENPLGYLGFSVSSEFRFSYKCPNNAPWSQPTHLMFESSTDIGPNFNTNSTHPLSRHWEITTRNNDNDWSSQSEVTENESRSPSTRTNLSLTHIRENQKYVLMFVDIKLHSPLYHIRRVDPM